MNTHDREFEYCTANDNMIRNSDDFGFHEVLSLFAHTLRYGIFKSNAMNVSEFYWQTLGD